MTTFPAWIETPKLFNIDFLLKFQLDKLNRGKYFGYGKDCLEFEGLLISDTQYFGARKIPWHYHENPYFAFVTNGHFTERNKKESIICEAGSLLFHNWEEVHSNQIHTELSGSLHVEILPEWINKFGLNLESMQGDFEISDTQTKADFYAIRKEFSLNDNSSKLAIDGILLQVFSRMLRKDSEAAREIPDWALLARDMIYESKGGSLSVEEIAKSVNVHPVTLSKKFSQHFGMSMGKFQRSVQISKAIELMRMGKKPLLDVAYEVGFYDQSHFNKVFKEFHQMTPGEFLKIIKG